MCDCCTDQLNKSAATVWSMKDSNQTEGWSLWGAGSNSHNTSGRKSEADRKGYGTVKSREKKWTQNTLVTNVLISCWFIQPQQSKYKIWSIKQFCAVQELTWFMSAAHPYLLRCWPRIPKRWLKPQSRSAAAWVLWHKPPTWDVSLAVSCSVRWPDVKDLESGIFRRSFELKQDIMKVATFSGPRLNGESLPRRCAVTELPMKMSLSKRMKSAVH